MARVLIIDDDEDVQAVLTQYLTHDGHAVRSARTGEQAFAEIAAETDFALPPPTFAPCLAVPKTTCLAA